MNGNYNGHNKPTEPGWYWFKDKNIQQASWEALLVFQDVELSALRMQLRGIWKIHELEGEWSTKLEEPEDAYLDDCSCESCRKSKERGGKPVGY